MKNIYIIGYILWFIGSFFFFKISTILFHWFADLGVIYKIIIILFTAVLILFGIYKILLSFFLLVNKNHQKFNLITTGFSVIGIIGIILSYINFGFSFQLSRDEVFIQSLTVTFGLQLSYILINGFVFFPKTLYKANTQ